MRRRTWIATAVGLGTALGAGTTTMGAEESVVPGQIIVELSPGASIDEINADYGTALINSIDSEGLFLIDVPEGMDDEQLRDLLADDARVVETEENEWADTPEAVAGDTQSFFFYVPPSEYDAQYALGLLGLGPAHTVTTGSGMIVAVLDTGIDIAHDVLAGMVLPNGYNFVDGNDDITDVGNGIDDDADGAIDEMTGHGTAVAGVVAMVAPDAGLLPIKILDSDGVGDVFRTAQGIYYAVAQGTHVINLSIGTQSNNQILRTAIEAANQAGIIVVASAGNMNRQHPAQMPAGDENTIGVAATDAADVKGEFSNFGTHIGLSAPGTNIVTTTPENTYALCSGTSLSAAFVSGAAALVRAIDAQAPSEQLEAVLLESAVNIDVNNPAYIGLLGTGRLNVATAVGAEPVAADLDGDWVVGINDFLQLLADWDLTDSPADIDGNGVVGIGDLMILIAAWN
ncbi:MAG: S8 family peptidase [Planctomycetota bacterium]